MKVERVELVHGVLLAQLFQVLHTHREAAGTASRVGGDALNVLPMADVWRPLAVKYGNLSRHYPTLRGLHAWLRKVGVQPGAFSRCRGLPCSNAHAGCPRKIVHHKPSPSAAVPPPLSRKGCETFAMRHPICLCICLCSPTTAPYTHTATFAVMEEGWDPEGPWEPPEGSRLNGMTAPGWWRSRRRFPLASLHHSSGAPRGPCKQCCPPQARSHRSG